ncbi:hypothetical protein [Roseovarius sp. D22-M7]
MALLFTTLLRGRTDLGPAVPVAPGALRLEDGYVLRLEDAGNLQKDPDA